MKNDSLITLRAEQLEALAMHLEETAQAIRLRAATQLNKPVMIGNMLVVETVLDSTHLLLRAINKSQSEIPLEASKMSAARRTGRRRRTRRRNG